MEIKKNLKFIRIARTVLILSALVFGVLGYVFSFNRGYTCREVSEKKIKQGDLELVTKECRADDGFYKQIYTIQYTLYKGELPANDTVREELLKRTKWPVWTVDEINKQYESNNDNFLLTRLRNANQCLTAAFLFLLIALMLCFSKEKLEYNRHRE
jgi:hypothetical protein